MLFTSTVFLYGFLPAVLLCYLLIGRTSKKTWPIINFLILSSFIFYGFRDPTNVLLLAISVTANFGFAKLIRSRNLPNAMLTLGIGFNLCLLFYFKYVNFFMETIATAASFPFISLTSSILNPRSFVCPTRLLIFLSVIF